MSTLAAVGDTIVSGSLLLAVPLAALAGLVSFVSPCVLPLVPGYLSFVTGLTGAELAAPAPDQVRSGGGVVTEAPARVHRRSRVLLGSILFVAGFSAVFVALGLLFGGLGTWLLTWSETLSRVLGVVVIVLGLGFLGAIPFLQREARVHVNPNRGLWGAPLLGVLFGLGWAPCIGPTLAAVLTLAYTEASAARGALLSLAYCVGLGLPFVLVGLALRRAAGALGWVRTHSRTVQRIGGVLLVVIGLLLVTGLWGEMVARTQSLVDGFTPVL